MGVNGLYAEIIGQLAVRHMLYQLLLCIMSKQFCEHEDMNNYERMCFIYRQQPDVGYESKGHGLSFLFSFFSGCGY